MARQRIKVEMRPERIERAHLSGNRRLRRRHSTYTFRWTGRQAGRGKGAFSSRARPSWNRERAEHHAGETGIGAWTVAKIGPSAKESRGWARAVPDDAVSQFPADGDEDVYAVVAYEHAAEQSAADDQDRFPGLADDKELPSGRSLPPDRGDLLKYGELERRGAPEHTRERGQPVAKRLRWTVFKMPAGTVVSANIPRIRKPVSPSGANSSFSTSFINTKIRPEGIAAGGPESFTLMPGWRCRLHRRPAPGCLSPARVHNRSRRIPVTPKRIETPRLYPIWTRTVGRRDVRSKRRL